MPAHAVLIFSIILAGGAMAAELKVIGSPGVRGVVNELAPQFAKATGHKVATDFAVIAVLKRRIEAGEAFDIVIPGPQLIDDLVRQGRVAADAHAEFGRTGVALGVRKGAPLPHIDTPERLKRALLNAKAVGHSKEGQSGVGFRAALDRLGISDAMRPKLRTYDEGGYAAALQRGEIDLVASGLGPLLEMRGVDLVGPLPPEVQSYVRFSIGVSTGTTNPEPARALMRYLTSPGVAPTFKSRGVERN